MRVAMAVLICAVCAVTSANIFEDLFDEMGVPGGFLDSAIFFRGDLPHGIEGKTVKEFSRRVSANSYNDCGWKSAEGEENKYGMECEYENHDLTFLFTYYPSREASRLEIYDTNTGFSGVLFVNAKIVSDVYLTQEEKAEIAREEEEARLAQEAKLEARRAEEAEYLRQKEEAEAALSRRIEAERRERENRRREADIARAEAERERVRAKEEYGRRVEAMRKRVEAAKISGECSKDRYYQGALFMAETSLAHHQSKYDDDLGSFGASAFAGLDYAERDEIANLEKRSAEAKAICEAGRAPR